ncbi:MAG: prepilin peptidase [Hyphomicrobiaceae bacterium]|nr:prepilin peptidase [Hyphomicrobiaceae bacterium]
MLEAAILIVFPLVVLFAAFTDLFTMTISNRVSLILVAALALLAPFVGLDLETLGWNLLAAGIVFALGFFCFAMGWVGGGDVKFATVVTLWLGAGLAVSYFALFALMGGALTLAILYYRNQIMPQWVMAIGFMAQLHDKDKGVPYGVALAAAAIILYPETIWMQALVM